MWVLLKDVPVGEWVFVKHFMGHAMVEGPDKTWHRGLWAIVETGRNKYAPDDILLTASNGNQFFENEQSYVWSTK